MLGLVLVAVSLVLQAHKMKIISQNVIIIITNEDQHFPDIYDLSIKCKKQKYNYCLHYDYHQYLLYKHTNIQNTTEQGNKDHSKKKQKEKKNLILQNCISFDSTNCKIG